MMMISNEQIDGSNIQLPMLLTKSSLQSSNPKLRRKLSNIRQSQQTIQKLDELEFEVQEDQQNHLRQTFVELLPQYESLMASTSYTRLRLGSLHKKEQSTELKTPRTITNFSSSRPVYDNPKQFCAQTYRNQKYDLQKKEQEQHPLKFRRLQNSEEFNSQNPAEDTWATNKWEEAQKYELNTGERLDSLLNRLSKNLKNLLNFKGEQYCIKLITKLVAYSKKLKSLIDIESTNLRDFSQNLLLIRYLRILYRAKMSQVIQERQAAKQLQAQQLYSNFNMGSQSNIATIETPRETSFPLIHEKQFLDNILDLHLRIEEYILNQQKNQINIFQSQVINITKQVQDKEIQYKNQLMEHQKKHSFMEFNHLMRNKYSLDLRCMKSKLAQQIKSCEDKNGDVQYVSKQNTNRADCLDKVITALERLEID